MSKILILTAAVILTTTLFAQSPSKMRYQAVIRDAAGQLITNQIEMQISILKGSPAGTAVYIETHTPVPDENGLVTIIIGEGIVVSAETFDIIDWSAGPYYIKSETDTGSGSLITGTSQLLSVPYALHARTAGGHYIGEFFGGGIIVAIVKTANTEHGLIASLTNLGPDPGSTWGDTTLIGITAQSLTDGQANTIAIVSQSVNTVTAANLCFDYVNPDSGTGVYSDWYLPSMRELEACYNANYTVTNILGPVNGFRFDNYWSSTENKNDKLTAYFKYFHLGILSPGGHRWHLLRVRAVRQF
jgi:hypothetical protein